MNKEQIIKALHLLEADEIDEFQVSGITDDIVDMLSEDEEETITLLKSLDENQLSWIASAFEELAFGFRSQKFIDVIEQLGTQYPDIADIKEYIAQAKETMNG